MPGTVDNAYVWEGADVYVAPEGTPLPTTATASLNGAFEPAGLLSDADGLIKGRSQDTNDLSAWGRGVVRTTKKNHKRTFQVTCLEDNDTVFGLANPGSFSSTVGGATVRRVSRPRKDVRCWVFQLTDGTVTKRIVVATGEVSDVAEVKLADDDFEATQLTVTAYPGTDGYFYYEYRTTDDESEAASSSSSSSSSS